MTPIEPGLPSYLQWGFACVRSRALQVGKQAFGMVPFADIANHAADPNADTCVAPAAAAEASADVSQQQQGAGGFVELVAVKDIPAGEEVTISYSGLQGYTNQRFMAQYGFVPAQGNPADRLELTVPDRWVVALL
jgi:predicted RecA/RadA family phage recombinase